MSANYTPYQWVDGSTGGTPIVAAQLSHIETGIAAVDIAATAKPRGSLWYDGTGAPGTIAGQQTNDQYLDGNVGDVYTFNGTAWAVTGNISGADGQDASSNEITQNLDGTWNLRVSKVSDPTIVCKWYWVIPNSSAPAIQGGYMSDTYPYDELFDKRGT